MNTEPKQGYYIGTMSGTSADGLDIVIAEVSSLDTVSQYANYFIQYPSKLTHQVQKLQLKSGDTLFKQHKETLSQLSDELARFFAKHIKKFIAQSNLTADQFIAIGNHGQTILHKPNAQNPFSLQICNPKLLADLCNIPVIADFRRADIEIGGQGAPLMPAFHAAIFKKYSPCAVVNIGGISNTSLLSRESTLGFDNGPGNTLMDAWTKKHQQHNFDKNGEWAKSGIVSPKLLAHLLNDLYFSKSIPKSTGQDTFNMQWLEEKLSSFGSISQKDVQATLCDLTAKSIIDDIKRYEKNTQKVYICGGGAKNQHLMERIQYFAGTTLCVNTTSHLNIDPDWVEALGFAWLAYCNKNQIASNLPSVTGAKKAIVLGQRFDPKPMAT